MEDPVFIVMLVGGALTLIIIFVLTIMNSARRKENIRKRNAINNVIADLIEKRAISFAPYDYFGMKKNPDYRPVNKVEKAILEHGFGKHSAASPKEFHIRLRKNLNDLRYAVDRTDSRLLDFETAPKTRVSNSDTSDTSAIIPFVAFGGVDGNDATHLNPNYVGDPDYSGNSSGDGGWSGGDCSGGGDGGGGGGGGD